MSITKDTLQKHLTDPAVFCCRRAKGTVIGADDLEDPTLFDDMVDAGLLTLSDDGLTIEEVLGSTLLQDVEALTPITKDVLDKVNAKSVPAEAPAEPVKASPAAPAAPTAAPSGTIHLKIDKLEGLSLDIPADLPDGLLGDGPKLARCLGCLVDNGLKFTHQGGVVIQVRGRRVGPDDMAQ